MRAKPRRYTPEEIRFLREICGKRSIAERARLFNERFSPQVTARQIINACSVREMHKKTVRMFTTEEKRFVEANIPGRSMAKVTVMFNANFNPPVSYWRIKNLCKENGWTSGSNTPIGTEKVGREGRTKTKIAPGKWRAKSILVWEEANGKIPEGHFVIFADGNRQNHALENLMIVSAAEFVFMNRNKLRSADPDITRLGHTMAKMRIAASRAVREKTGARSFGQFMETKELGKLKKRERDGKDTHVQA